ncbi:M20/M25/M40 family metallo-hydrolase [Sphingobium algorifonticola]|uniref:Carboxypeptidase Q n=1 Tax=Sphingobium algorifonticola TaxID=2008318 RepID=A0A437J4B0_9SPHN|nr:M20/M25/M40 family metallo-hydrolase [Sphingobium algorifonticola]RVT39462.1 peptidase M28 family protein [Sphingobium algorifonticola]
MQKIRSAPLALALSAMSLSTPAMAAPPDVAGLQEKAMADEIAWDFVSDLTTEVGPRPAGTADEARGRDWAVARLKALGFANVRAEPYIMPTWVRGAETAKVVAPFPQTLIVTALGNSGATPANGLEAEVVYFPTIADLEAAAPDRLKGKIAFVSHAMKATQDGSSYGYFGIVRRQGPSIAAKKGAAAILIRSIGTDNHRTPHTGVQMWAEGVTPIPAAALSVPDAENLERMLRKAQMKGGKPVRVALTLTPRFIGDQASGNVIAEVPGTDPAAGIIVAACHLDSWDLGTGAIDDGAGCAIASAAARLVMKNERPRRTIRLLLAGSEEVGGFGARAYFAAHKEERHVLALESDFGADRVWRVDFKFPAAGAPLAARIADALAPLGIGKGSQPAGGGADIAPLVAAGVPVIDLQQDGTRYFDLHHTADDTLDKIDPAQLRQNVAAWATVLALAANADEQLR